jgi:hypothetical protein
LITTVVDVFWGHLHEAQGLYERVLRMRERTLGAKHRNTLATVSDLAWTLCELRRPTEARPHFERFATALVSPAGLQRVWPRLGLALCDVLETVDAATGTAVIAELVAMVGPEHERVTQARERLAAALRPSA